MKNRAEILKRIKEKGKEKEKKSTPQNATKIQIVKPFVPVKKDVYDTYVLWYSIPLAVKQLSEPERIKMNLSPLAMELTQVRTIQEFAKKYGVDRGTISDWNKKTKWEEIDTGMKVWFRAMSSNWRLSLYKKAMRTGNAPEVKLLEQIFMGFSENAPVVNNNAIFVLDEGRKAQIKELFRTNAHRRRER